MASYYDMCSHQARFQQPYRVVLPKSMAGHAQYIHHLHAVQSGGETAPIMEQATLPGQTSAQDIRMLQWQQLQQQQQQQAQQQQMLLQQAKLQQQQQEQQAAAVAAAAKRAESVVVSFIVLFTIVLQMHRVSPPLFNF